MAQVPTLRLMIEIDWTADGYEGRKHAYLAASAGFFYDRHRAANDCLAGVELLARRHAARLASPSFWKGPARPPGASGPKIRPSTSRMS
jgi:hypothetical protein